MLRLEQESGFSVMIILPSKIIARVPKRWSNVLGLCYLVLEGEYVVELEVSGFPSNAI